MSEPSVVDAAGRRATRHPPVPLAWRGDGAAPTRFHRGAHPPYAIRWFGSTALLGHLRRVAASIVASQAVDTRDWMRPERPHELLGPRRARPEGAGSRRAHSGGALDRPLWIDFVADTGDDRDVSAAVARLVFAETRLPRAPTARSCRAATSSSSAATPPTLSPPADEILRRVIQPWNEVLQEVGTGGRAASSSASPATTTGTTVSTGSRRLFRRMRWSACSRSGRRGARTAPGKGRPAIEAAPLSCGSFTSTRSSDPWTSSVGLSIASRDRPGRHRPSCRAACAARLHADPGGLDWALPLAPGLELWGVDRQLRRLDFRQRTFFIERRRNVPPIVWCSWRRDPALSFGERNPAGQGMLAACHLTLERDRVLYLSGDLHHYERRPLGESLHVIAGGGGAFLHGTRIPPSPLGPAARAYPDAAVSRRLAVELPWKLLAGTPGFLPHMLFGLFGAIQLWALGRSLREGGPDHGARRLHLCRRVHASRPAAAAPARS